MSEDFSFEREKWLADVDLRRRDLDLKEREQGNRDIEVRLKEREQRASTWRSPLIVAILAAAAAAAGNALVAVVNGLLQRDLEDKKRSAEIVLESSKAESTRILEMIKTGDPERAAANLEFLLRSGLIADPTLSSRIENFLKTRKPGSGPSLPSPAGRVGFEQSKLLTEPMRQTLQNMLSRYFDYLDRIGFPKPKAAVTVSVKVMDSPNAYYVDNRIVIDRRMVNDTSVALREYNHHILTARVKRAWTGHFGALESGLADYFACSFLNNPNLGEIAAKIYDPKSLFIRSLTNKKTYANLSKVREFQLTFEGGEVWGGFFWSMRERLGASVADSLIASAWLSFDPPSTDSLIPSAYLAALSQAAKVQGPKTLDAVRAAATARQLPHP